MALEEKGQGLSNSPPCRAVRTASALTSGSRPKNRCWQAVKKSRIPVPNSMRHQRRLPDTGRWQRGYCRTKTRSAAQSVLYRASLHEFVGFSHSAQCHEKRTRQQSMPKHADVQAGLRAPGLVAPICQCTTEHAVVIPSAIALSGFGIFGCYKLQRAFSTNA